MKIKIHKKKPEILSTEIKQRESILIVKEEFSSGLSEKISCSINLFSIITSKEK